MQENWGFPFFRKCVILIKDFIDIQPSNQTNFPCGLGLREQKLSEHQRCGVMFGRQIDKESCMREKYESLSVSVLRELAKSRGIKGTSGMKKANLVEAMLAKDEEEAAGKQESAENGARQENREPRESAQRQEHHESGAQRHEQHGRAYNKGENPRHESQRKSRRRFPWRIPGRPTGFSRLCRTGSDLSDARIICPGRTMCTCPPLRSASSI